MTRDQTDCVVEDQYDVLIAGAGPCGLTTALALRKACPELKIAVLERAKAFRPSGGNIGWLKGTLDKILGALGQEVADALESICMPRHVWTNADKTGQARKSQDILSFAISWFDMQQMLLSHLPDGIVRLNSAVQTVWTSHVLKCPHWCVRTRSAGAFVPA
jgi:2-polyprenyl-6-methoxyphenol hydroxylase-like FAD-dependent oxidoreductase